MRGINLHEDFGWSNAPRIPMSAAIIGGSAALGAGSSLLGAGKSSSASKAAAGQSLQATYAGIANQQQMYGQNVGRFAPYVQSGYNALVPMQTLAEQAPAGQPYLDASAGYRNLAAGYLQQAAGMDPSRVLTQQGLEQTPGYQFALQQGLQATQSAAAAKGLGISGAALKEAANYATGLANQTYTNRFSEAQQSWQDVINQGQSALNLGTAAYNQGTLAQQLQQQQYGQWQNLGNLGENAAAQSGQAGTAAANAITSGLTAGAGQAGNYLQNAGQAQAAGTAGVGNALTSGVNNYLNYNMMQQFMGNPSYFSGGSSLSALSQPGATGTWYGQT